MHFKSTGLVGKGKWGKILQEKINANSKLCFTANSRSKYFDKLDEIDWVFIATPDSTHYKIVNKCIEKKINIFCEKPLTKTYSQSLRLFEKAKKNKILLYVDEIQSFLNKKIELKKKNYIIRRKKGTGDPKSLLFRFAYHDFYFLYDKLKKEKINNIKIINVKDNLEFEIIFGKKTFSFYYDLNVEKKIHKFNSVNLITKKDILSKMIKDVLNEKVNFENNKNKSLFANKIIDKIIKKL
jgi:hypothetical protein|tara:strand:- start:346 stop:1062 length:717 start_codon:yes stop_codon:yes gene_type:complete